MYIMCSCDKLRKSRLSFEILTTHASLGFCSSKLHLHAYPLCIQEKSFLERMFFLWLQVSSDVFPRLPFGTSFGITESLTKSYLLLSSGLKTLPEIFVSNADQVLIREKIDFPVLYFYACWLLDFIVSWGWDVNICYLGCRELINGSNASTLRNNTLRNIITRSTKGIYFRHILGLVVYWKDSLC
jgi:hypothetical protein